MKKLILALLLAGFLAGCAISAHAQDAAPVTTGSGVFKDTPAPIVAPDQADFPLLATLRGDSDTLKYDYLGKADDIGVWLLSGPSVMQTIFTLPNNYALVGGVMIGPDGKELGPQLLNDFMKREPQRAQEIMAIVKTPVTAPPVAGEPAAVPSVEQPIAAASPPASPSEALWRELGQTGYVSYGKKPGVPVIYVVLDPAQKATKDVWRELAPLAKTDQIILHVIPLALTTGDSVMDIASVLGGSDPQALWDKLMAGQPVQGGDAPDGQKVLAIENTVKMAQRIKLRTAPFFVYRVPVEGVEGKVRIIRGVPRDWAAFKAELSPIAAPPASRPEKP